MTVLLGWSGRRYRQSLHGGDTQLAASAFVLGGSRGSDAEGAVGSAIGCTIRRETEKVGQCASTYNPCPHHPPLPPRRCFGTRNPPRRSRLPAPPNCTPPGEDYPERFLPLPARGGNAVTAVIAAVAQGVGDGIGGHVVDVGPHSRCHRFGSIGTITVAAAEIDAVQMEIERKHHRRRSGKTHLIELQYDPG